MKRHYFEFKITYSGRCFINDEDGTMTGQEMREMAEGMIAIGEFDTGEILSMTTPKYMWSEKID